MCLMRMIFGTCQECIECLYVLILWVGWSFMLHIQLSPSHSNMVGHTTLGTWQSPIPLPSMLGRQGSSFPGCIPPNDTVDSESGGHYIWWSWCGDSVAGWWIYSHLVGRVLHCSITHIPCFCRQGVTTNPFSTWTRLWGLPLFAWLGQVARLVYVIGQRHHHHSTQHDHHPALVSMYCAPTLMVNASDFICSMYIGTLAPLMHIKLFSHLAYTLHFRADLLLAHILQ